MSIKKDRLTNIIYNGLNISNSGIYLTNCSNITIMNSRITDCSDNGIHLYKCDNVLIINCRIERCLKGVYAQSGSNIQVINCAFKDLNVAATPRNGQSVQFNRVLGGNCLIFHNVITNDNEVANPEDNINMYQSIGIAGSPILIDSNYIQGGHSKNGSGIMLGDGSTGGSYITARNNILLNPGQVGIGVAGGSFISVLNNQLYAKQQLFTNVGMYTWNQSTLPCDNITVSGNRVSFIKNTGKEYDFWNGSGYDGSSVITNLVITNNNWNDKIIIPYQEPQIPAGWGSTIG